MIDQVRTPNLRFETVRVLGRKVTVLPPSWFAGWPVEIWIDNAGAIGALIKGYSGKPDSPTVPGS